MRIPLLALPLLAGLLAAQEGTGAIEGIVVNPNTGEGISGVSITLFTRQAVRYETVTSQSGSFRVTGVMPGAYEVRFEKDGYVLGRREPVQPYRVASGQDAVRVRLEMTRQLNLGGRVLDNEGNPAPNAQIRLNLRVPVTASERGEFLIKDVAPGFYTLLASPQPPKKSSPGEERVEPIPTYFPSSTELADTQRIVVRGDSDLTNLEIRLRAAPVHRVRGVVLNEMGTVVVGATVRLMPITSLEPRIVLSGLYLVLVGPRRGAATEVAQYVTDANGAFEFPSVPSGDWQIAATISGSIDSVDYLDTIRTGAATALVANSDVDNVQILVGARFALNVSSDPPNLRASISLVSADGRLAIPAIPEPQSDGSIRLKGVSPGRYYIVPIFSLGFYPASILIGGREVAGQAIALVSESQPIQVFYKPALGSVRGKVEGANAMVVLIPEQISSLAFGRTERPRPDGTFELTGIAPGSYVAAALSGIDDPSRLDPTLLSKILLSGTRVRVEDAGSADVNLTAMPWLAP